MAVCLCPINLISVSPTCMECVHASVYVFMSTWVLNSAPSPMHSDMETWMSLCGIVHVPVTLLLVPKLGYKCTCISTGIYVHFTHHVCSTPFRNVHGNMGTPLWHYEFVTLIIFHYTSWLEGVHASVHVLLSTWLLMSASPQLHTYMERLVPLCGTGYVFQSSMSGPTPCLKFTHASIH